MFVALILFLAIFCVGILLYAEHSWHLRRSGNDAEAVVEPKEECCGMHITCEKDSLLASVSKEIEYYDDEEFDRFAGKDAADYTPDEIEEFRDILLSMRPDDIAGWARSLQLRQIKLPGEIRDELIMVVSEARQARHVAVS